MQSPVFQDPQFLDASGVGGLNTAFGTVSGAIAALGSGVWAAAGLVSPEAMTTSFSGLVATIGLPAPWGVVTSGGALVRAHGTQTGQDTQSYTPTFSGLVPATGSITAYLAATITSIQQNPFPIPGPPAGDPSYNPNYVPTEGYATNLLSVALTAVSGQPNNVTSFELLRTTLSAGQSTITTWSTVGQQRATPRDALAPIPLASGGLLTVQQAQGMLLPAASGLTHTLPPVSGAGGLSYHLFNPLGSNWTIATTGSDLIGTPAASGGVSSMVVPPSGSATLWGNAASGTWEVAGSQVFAALGGNAAVPFQTANATPATQQAVPISQGDARYAALAGSASQTFSVANATTATEAMALGQATGRLLNVQTFTTVGTATYTPTSGTTSVIVEVQGGGAAGGGSVITAANGSSTGAPGTSGAYGRSRYTSAFSGVTVTVGAGGVGVNGAGGNNGGASSFGSLLSCPGGVGGGSSPAATIPLSGGNGSTVSPTGANLISGTSDGGSESLSVNGSCAYGGRGGGTPYGGGAVGISVNINGSAAATLGAGGSGTASYNNGSGATTGGNGASGYVRVWEYA